MSESGWTFEVESCVDVRAGGLDVPALRAKAVGINPINPLHVIEMDGVMRPEDENGYRDKAQSDLDLLRLGVRGLRLGIAGVDVGAMANNIRILNAHMIHDKNCVCMSCKLLRTFDAAVADLDGKEEGK